jgi:lantibiotic modifying enzyme
MLRESAADDALATMSSGAVRQLERQLRARLIRITLSCYRLQWESYVSAARAVGIASGDGTIARLGEQFVGATAVDRLIKLFVAFPVLVSLWWHVINQWVDSVSETASRFKEDSEAIGRTFFSGAQTTAVVAGRGYLSDPHNAGRSVMALTTNAGPVIYKPRSGDGEWEWYKLLQWMNEQGFEPPFLIARMLRRDGYFWMEHFMRKAASDTAAARRFYLRIGGLICAAYLLRAVDFHRDNILGCGEHPVVVDAEALWHAGHALREDDPVARLRQTGFIADNASSWQQHSSPLAPDSSSRGFPRVEGRTLAASDFCSEILTGFRRAWTCALATPRRRAAITRRIRAVSRQPWRKLVRPTQQYAAIIRESITPDYLRNPAGRRAFLERSSNRGNVQTPIVRAEVRAMEQLDVPYFKSLTRAASTIDPPAPPRSVVQALIEALGRLPAATIYNL